MLREPPLSKTISADQFDLLPLGVCVLDRDLTIHAWNATLAEWTGISRADALGMNLGQRYPNLLTTRYKDRIKEVFQSGTIAIFSATLHGHFIPIHSTKDGSGQLMIQQTCVRPVAPESPYALVVIENATNLQRQVEELRTIRKELELRVQDRTAKLTAVNSTLQEETVKREDAERQLEHRVEQLEMTNQQLEEVKQTLGVYVEQQAEKGAELESHRNQLQAELIERRRVEQELVQAQKLESIGQLAAGIAHEINTPSQYVGDNIRFLEDAFRDIEELLGTFNRLLQTAKDHTLTDELIAQAEAAIREADIDFLMKETPKAIHQSLEGIDRVASIVRAMKEFSHPGSDQKKAIDLNRAIENTLTISRILNLVVNAAYAIGCVIGDGSEDKGTITVSTRHDGEWVEIRVRDTGTGIPEDIRSKVFDHFFTTKEVGKGTGQGLAIAHSVVVEKHGGTITFETEVGQGTTFIVRLPIADAPMSEQNVQSDEVQVAN